MVGATASPEFPTTPGTIDPVFAGDPFDSFVLKLNSAGSRAGLLDLLGRRRRRDDRR